MTLVHCPKCRQSFFDPGLPLRVYPCVDRAVHPNKFLDVRVPEKTRPVLGLLRRVTAVKP